MMLKMMTGYYDGFTNTLVYKKLQNKKQLSIHFNYL